MKIKTGDKIKILSGKDRGKMGKVVQVMKKKEDNQWYVVVEGANILKKHVRSGKRGEKGQIIELPTPVNVSNVMLIDPKSGKPTRVGFVQEGETKKRIARINNEFVD